jgi:Acyl-CoA synthetases (AMP-forming)/AMP-acid ligases II
MKISFSTLACPDWSWKDIISTAKDVGCDGVEVRAGSDDAFALHIKPFSEEQLAATVAKLGELKLEIPCFSSDCCLKYKDREEFNEKELQEYIELCAKTGTPYIRVLADRNPEPDGDDVDDAFIARQLCSLAEKAEQKNVTLLVETNGVFANSERLYHLLEQVPYDSVAALWDTHHTCRHAGEIPEQTVQNLGSYIKHVHVKDSVVENGMLEYRMMGEGDLPIDEMMRALNSINYEGYISLEWVKRWANDLQDPGIVIPHFVNYMSQYTAPTAPDAVEETASEQRRDTAAGKGFVRGELFDNNAKTGKYVWEKETLIDLTFPQVLDRMVEEFPDQYAFRYTTLDYIRTYSEFRDDVDSFARTLIALGVRRGDKVAIWATNVPQWFITFWAATKIGAVLVTVNTAYKIHEAEYLLRQSDTHTLVMVDGYKDSDYVGIIKEICPELASHTPGQTLHTRRLPFLRHIVTVESKQPGCLTWQQAAEYAEKCQIETVYARMNEMSTHDVCNMQYTSGTTGFPKGVMLTHHNVVNNGKNIGDRMDFSTADELLIHVPMFHCFGMVLAMTASMTHGTTMCPIPAFSPRLALEAISKEKITACHGVPTMYIAMMEHENFEKTDFSNMRTGIMAGSPCPVKVMQDVLEKMNMTEITIVFGQTESSPGCTMSSADDSIEVKVNTVGHNLPGIECKIVDPVTGEDLPDDTDGEFVARGYNIMKGYYKMPAATAAAIDSDGWLHTGDLARRRPDGNYKITGRIKDMIIRGGENIYPKEIEDFLYTYEKVKDVQVIGVPDKQYGEEIMACVILKDGAEATGDEIKTHVREHMAKHKTPKYVSFVTEFPMNAAGKILKYKMVEQAVEQLGLQEDSNVETA